MEKKINILPESLASKIAAGEVVQRPASVVKELLENSIDAGATKITIIIKVGGKSFIQVIDNGAGMSEEDALIAFQRHSTSKISTYDDLENIQTLGFRGEALASIAAVSHVELITRTTESDIAVKIKIEGIEIKENTKDALEQGSSITVRNLFFNTPARREFLKNNNVEFKHIFDVIVRIALSHPDIHIKFISGEETVFNLLPSSLEERIKDIFGEKLSDALLKVEKFPQSVREDQLFIQGFISKPDFARKTRVEQFLFLNNRYIVSRNLNHAAFQAYEYLLEKGNYPFFILFINLNPRKVDVNVHPSKLEVKFQDERSIYHMLNSAVKNTLTSNNLVPSVQMHTDDTGIEFISQFDRVQVINKETGEIFSNQKDATLFSQRILQSQLDIDIEKIDLTKSKEDALVTKYFQIHNQYILMLVEEGIMIIDQHAAHERILYERAVENFSKENTKSQQLLFPHTIDLTIGDAAVVLNILPDLEKLGFQIKIFGKNTAILEGVPVDVKPGFESTILQEIIDLYKENEYNLKLEPRDNLAKSFACKAAIKFGDPLNQLEMKSLVEQLFASQVPYVCPHGRPVVVKLPLSELAKRFGRTS